MARFGLEAALRLILGLIGAVFLATAIASLPPYSAGGFWQAFGSHLVSVAHLDFGTSRVSGSPAAAELLAHLPATLLLLGFGAVIALVIGIPAGLLAGFSRAAPVAGPLLLVLEAFPLFVIGIAMIWAATVLYWPLDTAPAGTAIPGDVLSLPFARAIALPAILVGLGGAGAIVTRLRQIADTLAYAPYREGLRRLGLPNWEIGLHYLLPEIAAGVLANLGEVMLALMGAVIVAEWIFQWPGAAAFVIKSVALSDWSVAAIILAVFAGLTLVADFIGALVSRALVMADHP